MILNQDFAKFLIRGHASNGGFIEIIHCQIKNSRIYVGEKRMSNNGCLTGQWVLPVVMAEN